MVASQNCIGSAPDKKVLKMHIAKKTKVGLVQIGEMFGDQYYFPYAVGLLQAYAQKNVKRPEDFDFLLPIYKRVKIETTVEYFSATEIVFFSVYIWNCQISLEVAKSIKQKKEDCIIVFGGPQVPEYGTGMRMFLEKNPFVDIACYGEGEMPFKAILENFKDRSWKDVPAIGFINKYGSFTYNSPAEKIDNFEESPSVYLEGIFDKLIEANPDQKWSALLETNRGCPFSCSYCYWGKKTRNRVHKYETEKVFNEIDWFSRKKIEFVFVCDANFGILKRDIAIVTKVAENKKKFGFPKAFSIQNTKNSTKNIFMLQKILDDSGLQKGVNLALQTLNENTLKHINRSNISMQTYKDLQHMFNQNRILTFSDMILALPGETYDTFTKGVSAVIESGQHNRIQFINLVVLENTEMATAEYQKKFGIRTAKPKMISHHTSLDDIAKVNELNNLVVETDAMPKNDWIRTRVFCWLTSLLYFNKLLQIPLMMIVKECPITIKELIESFINVSNQYDQISKIVALFKNKAKDIQNGNCEYIASRKWLNIWWPSDDLVFIKLCYERKLEIFYKESEMAITDVLLKNGIEFQQEVLNDAIKLNRHLIKLPFVESDLCMSFDYNVYEVFQGTLNGIDIPLKRGNGDIIIDRTTDKWDTWNDWLREVVWYGSKKGAYLYECKAMNGERYN